MSRTENHTRKKRYDRTHQQIKRHKRRFLVRLLPTRTLLTKYVHITDYCALGGCDGIHYIDGVSRMNTAVTDGAILKRFAVWWGVGVDRVAELGEYETQFNLYIVRD